MLKFRQDLYADVRVEDRFNTSIRFRDGALEENTKVSVKQAFLRVFDGEMWYYASTYDVDNLQEALDKLYASATPNADILNNPIVKRFEVNKAVTYRFKDNCVKNISLEEKCKSLSSLFGAIKCSEYLKTYTASYSDRYSEYAFYSSLGADIKYDMQLSGNYFSFSLSDGEDNFDNRLSKSEDSFEKCALTADEVTECIKEGENFLLNAKTVTPGTYPVILSPETAGVFAHESFGHKSEADFMLGDETMRKEWVLGKKVGSDILSIYDYGGESGSGYCPFDDEGTAAKKTYLIKNGVLTGRLHSATTAADLNEETTGNARAINCNFEPIVRMTSTIIEAGTSTVDELFAGVKHGYYIKTYKHGSGMSTFTIAPHLAYEIVDGKIGKPIRISVITGNVFETLNLIDGLSDKAEIISSVFGGCGKMEQYPLNVSFGGPYVRISKMNVQ